MGQTKQGATKRAAAIYGLTVQEYQCRIETQSYCNGCRQWKARDQFVIDRSRSTGLHKKCNGCRWVNGGVKTTEHLRGKPSPFKGRTHSEASRQLMSQQRKGELNARWKGGRVKLIGQIRNLGKFKEWRKAVYFRDNFTCQSCGTRKSGRNIILDADHIYPLCKILDDHAITTVEQAIECIPLWEVANGRALCRDCHKKTDTWGVNKQVYTDGKN